MDWYRRWGRWLPLLSIAVGCGESETSGGCGSSAERCVINSTATACGDEITLECFEGATPDAMPLCEKAIEQAGKAIYCCTSAAMNAGDEGAGGQAGADPGEAGGGSGGAGL